MPKDIGKHAFLSVSIRFRLIIIKAQRTHVHTTKKLHLHFRCTHKTFAGNTTSVVVISHESTCCHASQLPCCRADARLHVLHRCETPSL